MKQALIEKSRELGFDACGIAPAVAPPHGDAFERWLAAGMAAGMGWLERGREKRLDPERVLSGARSVIVLAVNYWQGAEEAQSSGEPVRGRVARYAWGEDYHQVIGEKLGALDRWLRERGGEQRWHVDTGPILEREYAWLAGIGWYGKSAMLLDRSLGKWFFLGVILTSLEMSADRPQKDRCGSCVRCIEACPTGALVGPRRLDARLCLSYLTIEHRGPIPEPLREKMGDRIFGCDACLEACPWNRFAQVSREVSFQMRDGARWPPRDYLGLDEAGFRELFRGSAILRAKRGGFLRNVCVALGNVGGREDLPALRAAARDADPLVGEHAAWAIGRIPASTRGEFPQRRGPAAAAGGRLVG
jgi:epoxyqueuosine reductase